MAAAGLAPWIGVREGFSHVPGSPAAPAPQVLECLIWLATAVNTASVMPSAMTMLRTGDSDDYPYLIIALTQLCTVTALHHSLLVSNTMLVALNILSFALGAFYIGCFLYVSSKKGRALVILLAEAILLVVVYGYLNLCCAVDTFTDALALISGSMSFTVNCTSCLDLVASVKSKSVRFDCLMLTSGFISSALLYLYGYAVNDFAIYIPQLPLLTIGAAKIMLILWYPAKPPCRANYGLKQ